MSSLLAVEELGKEYGVRRWFEENFQQLGFDRVLEEGGLEYKIILRQLINELVDSGVRLYKGKNNRHRPDYLGLKAGRWVRIEAEGKTSSYNHGPSYCEIVVCWINESRHQEDFKGIQVIEICDFFPVIDPITFRPTKQEP